MFYKYIFYKIYSGLQYVKSTNAHNAALGMVTALTVLFLYKVFFIVAERILKKDVTYEESVIPGLTFFAILYATNYFVLQANVKYLRVEKFFKDDEQPEYFNRLFIALFVFVVFILII